MPAYDRCPGIGVGGATAACVDDNAVLGHLVVLAKRVVTAAPAKDLAQSKQAGGGRSELRNSSRKGGVC